LLFDIARLLAFRFSLIADAVAYYVFLPYYALFDNQIITDSAIASHCWLPLADTMLPITHAIYCHLAFLIYFR